jgi:hypothetical protein
MRWLTLAAGLLVLGAQPGMAEHYALLVGINHVPGIGTEFDLRHAEADARRLRDRLIGDGFYAADHVQLLTGSAAAAQEQASKVSIRSALEDVLAPRLGTDDVLLVYLAMHGTLVRDGDISKRAFLPRDARKGLASTYVADAELATWLSRVRARKVVVLDVCFAGDRGTRFFRDPESRALMVPSFASGDPLVRSARAVITASGHDGAS